MDLRVQTSLIAALLSLALAGSVLLRARKRRVHWLFGVFGLNVGIWYLSTFLMRLFGGPAWSRVNLICGVLLPLAAVQFFNAFVGQDSRRITLLNRGAFGGAAVLLAVTFTPAHDHLVVRTAILLYVSLFMGASLALVYARAQAATSRFEGARLRYLALVGALAGTFTLFEYLPLVGLDIPPVGTVLVVIFLYVLSQSIVRYRLLDLYELTGRLGVLTALSFTLATILWVLVYFAGGRFFLHAVVSALVVLVLFDPIRNKVADKISQFFFRDRYDLEQSVQVLRRRIAHAFELEDLVRLLLEGLEQTRRVTHASVYLVGPDLRGYDLAGHVGPEPPDRLEAAPARPLLDRTSRDGALVLEPLERELEERRELGEDREAETLYEIVQTMEALSASVVVAIQSEGGDLYGLLCVRDERMRDAFSPEEVQLLGGLAVQAAIAVENSRMYVGMKERDRLAALGEMAAGIAHEIRNPLGAIKASAQYLTEPGGDPTDAREFLDIIVEEVDRLNRVVGSFLDYARPGKADASPIDVNAAVQRTMQLLAPETNAAGSTTQLALADDLPPVRIDPEQLRQVIINLVQNALQAMAMTDGGDLRVETVTRTREQLGGGTRRFVEIRVNDTGPGIPAEVREKLFLPFFTTKDRGTGLGLAISQRIVTAAGGLIEVRSHSGVGTTFIVRLPAVEESAVQVSEAAQSSSRLSSPGLAAPRISSPGPMLPEADPEPSDPEAPSSGTPSSGTPSPGAPSPGTPSPGKDVGSKTSSEPRISGTRGNLGDEPEPADTASVLTTSR